jgi:tetratricopeptide (TPR) repeat protein
MTTIARWVEVHRLAVAGDEAGIACDVGDRVGRVWLARSRFADVARLAEQTLRLGPHAGALYHLGWARQVTGFPVEALAAYEQALRLYRADHDRGNEAATLNNIGGVYARLGEQQRALEHYRQALPIQREVGDRAGEAVTRYNIAMIHRHRGELDRAISELERVVDLDRQVGHPDLQSDTATLQRLRQEHAQSDQGPP